MKSLILSFSLAGIAIAPTTLYADGPTQHIISNAAVTQGTTATSVMDGRLQEAAQDYASYAPVPRIGFYDAALPADADEYKTLDGFGVLLVTLVSQDKGELPPKRVYVMLGAKQVELHLFRSMLTSNDAAPDVQRVLGNYRWDGIYCYPVYLSQQAQELRLDFAKNRDGFVLARYDHDAEALPETLRSVNVVPPHGETPDAAAFMRIVQREYPGLIEKMTGADNPAPGK